MEKIIIFGKRYLNSRILAHHIVTMVTYNIYCFFRNSTVCGVHSGKVSKKFIGNFYFWGITWVISICLWFESGDSSDSIMSIWVQRSRLPWPVNIKIKEFKLSLNWFFSISYQIPREFSATARWPHWIFGLLSRPHFSPLKRMTAAKYEGLWTRQGAV